MKSWYKQKELIFWKIHWKLHIVLNRFGKHFRLCKNRFFLSGVNRSSTEKCNSFSVSMKKKITKAAKVKIVYMALKLYNFPTLQFSSNISKNTFLSNCSRRFPNHARNLSINPWSYGVTFLDFNSPILNKYFKWMIEFFIETFSSLKLRCFAHARSQIKLFSTLEVPDVVAFLK